MIFTMIIVKVDMLLTELNKNITFRINLEDLNFDENKNDDIFNIHSQRKQVWI